MTSTMVRRATPADAATVQMLLLELADLYVREPARGQGVGEQIMCALAAHGVEDRLLIRWGLGEDNNGACRFYERLGATLRTKTVAAWRPHDYAARLASR